MAIARCENHRPAGQKYEYTQFALPTGYPSSGVICGRVSCEESARLWLTSDEVAEHQAGKRVFGIRTHSAKVRVSDELIAESKAAAQ